MTPKCPTCGMPAHESRMGAPCYICVAPSIFTDQLARTRMGFENEILTGSATITNSFANQPPLTLDTLRDAMKLMPKPLPQLPEFNVVPADQQKRTPCDVPVAWVRPRVPSKRGGRRGTRRAWKRRHPPHQTYTYREPTDAIVLVGSARKIFDWERTPPDLWLVTPKQMAAIERAIQEGKAP